MASCSRRTLLEVGLAALPLQALTFTHPAVAFAADNSSVLPSIHDLFPTQPPELVREMVLVSHFDLKRVRELVGVRPTLAKAAWDWGFGDWETALGAASHMGNRPVAEFLISQGAHPTLFSAAMLGHLDVVKAFVSAQPGAQRIRGPHSIPLLAHAEAGGSSARPVYEYLKQLGDAGEDPPPPIPDGYVTSIVGTYLFGAGPNQQVEISVEKGKLTWTRKGTFGRWLVHAGDRSFYPIGAPGVRIRFAEEDGAMAMTVHDPDVVLTARRRAAPK